MAEQRILVPLVLVRVQVSQHIKGIRQQWRVPFFVLGWAFAVE